MRWLIGFFLIALFSKSALLCEVSPDILFGLLELQDDIRLRDKKKLQKIENFFHSENIEILETTSRGSLKPNIVCPIPIYPSEPIELDI